MVGGLNPDNFIVRQNRRVVEKWSDDQAWSRLGDDERAELLAVIAPLPQRSISAPRRPIAETC
ncbi:hypothetical protein D3C87_1806770 [compost metagenome]